MHRIALAGFTLASLLLSAGCGRAIPPLGSGHDGGRPIDAGPGDAGPDAGPVDAGPDAGPVDAGPEDAGPTDAGYPDGGPPTPCVTHADCSGGQVCIQGFCAFPGTVGESGHCGASRDCQPTLFCSAKTDPAACFPAGSGDVDAGCVTDANCLGTLRCVYTGLGGRCGPGGTGDFEDPCTAQTDCLPGLFCTAPGDAGGRICAPFATAFPPWPGVTCQPDTGQSRFYFQVPRAGTPLPDFFRLPYPNDARGGANGLALDITDFPTPGPSLLDGDLVALYKSSLMTDFAGFSPIGPVTFRTSTVIDDSTLINSVVITDLTHPNNDTFFWSYEYVINGTNYNCSNRLTIGPGEATPYLPGDTYAILILTGVKDSQGNFLIGEPDLATLLLDTPPTDTSLGHAYTAYQPLRAFLDGQSTITRGQIIAASVFTVGVPQATMTAVAATVKTLLPPATSDVGVCGLTSPSTCDALGADHACSPTDGGFFEIHGRMALPNFQEGTPPYATPSAGGDIVVMADGGALTEGTMNVCFALTVPQSLAPPGGWPLVITHHGTGGSMTNFITSGVAARLGAGVPAAAVLGFDAVEHADRRGTSTQSPEDLVFNIVSPRAARDNFLQGASDILNEAKLAGASLTVDAGPVSPITFNANEVVFFGHSQGATSGELALPFLDATPAAVLSGAGAHLTQSLLYKTSPLNSLAGIAALIQESPGNLDSQHPVLGLWQNFFDRSDPLNANPSIIYSPLPGHAPHNILMTWGAFDTYTPEQTLNANAASLGIPVCGPWEVDGGPSSTCALPDTANVNVNGTRYTDAALEFANTRGEDGHFVAFDEPGAATEWAGFIDSAFVVQAASSGPPTIP